MPFIILNTNVKIADSKAFVAEFSKFIAEVIQKPEAFVTLQYNYNDSIIFGGSFDSTFNLTVASISLATVNLVIAPDELMKISDHQVEMNEAYSKKIFEWLDAKLGLKHDRGYIMYMDPGRDRVGYMSTTVKALFG